MAVQPLKEPCPTKTQSIWHFLTLAWALGTHLYIADFSSHALLHVVLHTTSCVVCLHLSLHPQVCVLVSQRFTVTLGRWGYLWAWLALGGLSG